jgi:hypothetical protein
MGNMGAKMGGMGLGKAKAAAAAPAPAPAGPWLLPPSLSAQVSRVPHMAVANY